jgi:hypothetical protein
LVERERKMFVRRYDGRRWKASGVIRLCRDPLTYSIGYESITSQSSALKFDPK